MSLIGKRILLAFITPTISTIVPTIPNEIIEKNKEKAEQKRIARNEKNGVYREQVLKAASTNTKSVSSKANSTKSFAEKEKIIEEAKMKNMKKKNGSIGSRVNMVNDFNERNKK